MYAEHHIDDLIIDLSFTTTRLARHEKAALAEWLSDDLLPAIDQLFSRISPGKQILRFETLEFDFGNLDSRNYQQKIREQLLVQFTRLLQAQLIALPLASSGQFFSAQDEQQSQAALAQTLEYLSTGKIRAHHSDHNVSDSSAFYGAQRRLSVDKAIASHANDNKQETSTPSSEASVNVEVIKPITGSGIHEQLLEQVLGQHNIAELLRQFPDKNTLVQRLLKQFSEQQRLEILRQLIPLHLETAVTLLDLLQFIKDNSGVHYSINSAAINTIDNKLLHNMVWQELLLDGLENEFSAGNLWLSKLINRIATALSVPSAQLQQYLLAIQLPEHSTENAPAKLQQQIAQTAASAGRFDAGTNIDQISIAVDNQLDKNQRHNPDNIRLLIATALVRGDAHPLLELWPELITSESQLVSTALKHYLIRPEIRQQVMLNFPIPLLVDMVGLLAPQLNTLFLQLQGKVVLLIDSVHELSGFSGHKLSVEQFQRRLWEIAIELVLKDESGISTANSRANEIDSTTGKVNNSLNEKAFLIAVITAYAQSNSVEPQSLHQRWLALLNNLPLIRSPKSTNHKDDDNLPIAKLEHSLLDKSSDTYSLENQTQEYSENWPQDSFSSSARDFIAERKSPIITSSDLTKVSDHQLFDLCLRLKSGALTWSQLPDEIELLQRLISSYIRLGHSATAENCADFVAAIDMQAETTASRVSFYTRVLQALIADKLVDLEEIALGLATNVNVAKNLNTEQTTNNITASNEATKVRTLTVSDAATKIRSEQAIIPIFNFTAANVDSSLSLDQLAAQLYQGKIQLQALQLNQDQLAQLIDTYVYSNTDIAKEMQPELLTAIHQHAWRVSNIEVYYERVLQQLIDKTALDLTVISEQTDIAPQIINSTLISSPLETNSALESTAIEISVYQQREVDLLPAAVSSNHTTSLTNSQVIRHESASWMEIKVVPANASAIVQSILVASNSAERLRQLNIDAQQWQLLIAEFIRQSNKTIGEYDDEFLQAIDNFARRSVNTNVYYRLVANALVKQLPIDLEAFAIATTANISYTPLVKSEQLDPALNNSITTENQSTPVGTVNNISPDSAIEYSQLTGSDESLHKPTISLAQLLAAEQPLNQEQLLALQQHINILINHSNPALLAEWQKLLADTKYSQRLVNEVPAHLLHKIVMRLQPDAYVWLDSVVKAVIEALALLITDINSLVIKQIKWLFIFSYLFSQDKSNNTKTENTAHATELSRVLCEQLAVAMGMDDVQRLINLTQRRIALLRPPAQQKPSMRLQDVAAISNQQNDGSAPQWDAGLHINNAGQVLAAAFLPRLFSMLNLMSDGKFIDLGAADRAIHLLQFMVTGNSQTPEYDLVLNKILCGVGTSIPVSAGIEITEQEQTLIEQMLTSMIQHWKVLGSTSIAGLRETFFQRQGWLVLEDDCWRLKVKEQTFDMLIDHLPWSISLIKHGWMDKPLRVSWRNDS
ncbi:MAG: contractile injection system tape measure protein [Cellvibrio sp.]|uniref:contractile injection system tape measure protein n=1 Tax=Cellvibrio sp. TaxID=1965322 RepID=UPI0031A97933